MISFIRHLKKPYIKKRGKIFNFTVWIVDGDYVRKNLDTNFVNFDHHLIFNFIPENEFWIDKTIKKDEIHYCIDHLLLENRLMKKGLSYKEAYRKANIFEERERVKSRR